EAATVAPKPKIPSLETHARLLGDHLEVDRLLACLAGVQHGPERVSGESQAHRRGLGRAVRPGRSAGHRVNLSDVADEISGEVDQMRGLLVDGATGERFVIPPGHGIARAGPVSR